MRPMAKMTWCLFATALAIGASTGCSSDPPPRPKRGTLPPGTAALSVDGADVGTTEAVRCSDIAWSKMITTGDDDAGASVMISNANRLVVESVEIRNLNGFTGNYNRDLAGDASVAMIGATYRISGNALGYKPTSIAPITRPFSIRVAC
jgi:lipoprotein LpqH